MLVIVSRHLSTAQRHLLMTLTYRLAQLDANSAMTPDQHHESSHAED